MIGRKYELGVIRDCIDADRSRLIVVYGRRRVGKTFLIQEAFGRRFTFTHTGIEGGTFQEQLGAFWRSLKERWNEECPRPKSWMEAFDLLKKAVSASSDRRKTVFIDELPWMDTPHSGFVKAVEDFWNGWANVRTDVVMVVCGSAAAWMTKKVLRNRGGLFNRASRTIRLAPFTLAECEQFASAQGMVMDRKDIASAYMIFGGSPYYWTLLEKKESLSQNIDRLFFAEGAELADEFRRLYRSVFANPDPYVSIVTALATKKIGMTRDEITSVAEGISNNGALSECLENLQLSGFVRKYAHTGNASKLSVYQLIDGYTLFYFSFVRDNVSQDPHFWSHLLKDQRRVVWEGLAFERVCLLHAEQIKAALGVAGVATAISQWRCHSDDPETKGAQIDLVIERSDRVTNLCEMKFASERYEITAAGAESLREKAAAFRRETGTKANCHITFVTTYGIRRNAHSACVQSEVTLDDLFRE